MASNMVPTSQDGQLVTSGWLSSGSSEYRVESLLGHGNFGKVVKCTRMADRKTVAIKMIKNEGCHIMMANQEVSALMKLKLLDSDKCNLVQWYQVFTDRGHICLEFEHLDKSLFDFMRERYFRPLHLKELRPIVQQLASALHHLKAAGIIHADIKLENVMLVNHARESYRIKVIDFGLACNVSAAKQGSYIQSRPYRSPEIILGLPFTEAIDVWSLGCMAATLYLGCLLYPGKSEYDMMRYIVETQGQLPDNLLSSGCKTGLFFHRDDNSTTSLWKLKTPEEFHWETGIQPKETKLKFSCLDDFLHIRAIKHEISADKVAEMTDALTFVDMLKGMLHLDAAERMTPRQILGHHFINMCHIVSLYSVSSYVRSCSDIMEACQVTQTSSSTDNPVQHSSPPPPVERIQPHYIGPQPCTNPVKSGMIKKIDDEDMHETSHLSSRVESRWHRYTHLHQSHYYQSVRSHPAQPRHHSANAHPSSYIEPGLKRKMTDGEDVGHQQMNSDHSERSHEDRKKFRKNFAAPSTSYRSSQSHSHFSLGVKRKMTHDEDSDYYDRSGQEKKRVRKSSTQGSSNYSTHTLHARPEWRSSPAEQHCHSPHPASSSQAESRSQSGLKRKVADDDDDHVRHRKRTSDLRSDYNRERYVACFEDRRRIVE